VREPRWDRGLIFGLIRLRSPRFIGIQINAAMPVADVNGIRRTVIPPPENRKVGGYGRFRWMGQKISRQRQAGQVRCLRGNALVQPKIESSRGRMDVAKPHEICGGVTQLTGNDNTPGYSPVY
jgi:hypothetical protein